MKARATANRSALTNHEASRPLEGAVDVLAHGTGELPGLSSTSAHLRQIVLFHAPRPKTDLPLWALLSTDAVNER